MLTDFITAVFNGASFSSILILTALGLSITFGVMKVINMAHGDMMMLGAYCAYFFSDKDAFPRFVHNAGATAAEICNFGMRLPSWILGASPPSQSLYFDWKTDFGFQLPFPVVILLAFLSVGAIGYLMEVTLIRFLYGRPLDTLLATWGVGMVIQQVARKLFGADLHRLSQPSWLEGRWDIADADISHFRLFIILFTFACLGLVYLWFYKTRFGLQIRAVTQNRPMAASLGISTRRVDSLTFAFGTGLAGVAGCIMAHLYTFHPEMGNEYIVDAFMVVILGGTGQLMGTAVAGFGIGTGQSVLYIVLRNLPFPTLARSAEMMAKVTVLVLVLCLILYRPSGIFAPRERTYD
jgi:urea transport system permease protein